MSLEKDIQAKIIAKMEAHGWYVIKLIQTNKNGIPDLLCHKLGMTRYLEVKRPNLKPSPLQKMRMQELMTKAGVVCWVVTSVDDLYLYGIINLDDEPTKSSRNRAILHWSDREERQQGVDRPIF